MFFFSFLSKESRILHLVICSPGMWVFICLCIVANADDLYTAAVSLFLSPFLSFALARSLLRVLSLSISLALSRSRYLSVSLSLSLSLSISLSLSLTLCLSRCLSLSDAHTGPLVTLFAPIQNPRVSC